MAVAPEAELTDIVGAKHVRSPDAAYTVDGVSARTVVIPGSYQEVADVLRHANTNGLAVIPFGGGTMVQFGNLPSRYDIALDMSRLNEIVEYEPADLTVTCQAGMPLSAAQDRLAGSGQMLPIGPLAEARASIGGILGTNAIGGSVHSYGRPRDVTIGMRVATPDGRIARAGGRVVKNVAGYDLSKLHIGALGTLGLIVEATFKITPLAPADGLCSFLLPRVEDACQFVAKTLQLGLSIRAVEIACEGEEYLLTIDLSGSPRAVERSEAQVKALAPQHSATPSEASPALSNRSSLVCRLSVLPTDVPVLVGTLRTLDPRPSILVWPTVGFVFASWEEFADELGLINQVRAVARGGRVVVERCSPEAKASIDVFGPPPPSFPLMRAIKQQFDPNGILSPGRFVGRL